MLYSRGMSAMSRRIVWLVCAEDLEGTERGRGGRVIYVCASKGDYKNVSVIADC